MVIKRDADEAHFRFHLTERQVATQLDEGFFVTFGRTHGELSKWLVEAKPHMKERFGFAKELLVIYSGHQTTDARVLTAIENISRDPEFKHRIDRAVVLLIHAGDPEATRTLLRERLDWIVVPLPISSLMDPKRGDLFLRARIAESIGNVDLFGMSSPITEDKYFFGRDDVVQQLVTRCTERSESAGLFGLRKTGKTSVLFAIKRRLSGTEVLAEYIDCQNPGIHAARWWDVLERIACRCATALQTDHKRKVMVKADYSQANAGDRFLTDIRQLLADGQLAQIVLLFDEIEYITPQISGALGRHWDTDFVPFWQTVRSVHQEVHGRLTFVVAGVNPAAVTTSHFHTTPNPIFQLAPPTFLAPLDAQRVREMVRTIGRYSGLNIAEPVYGYLTKTYGGHPFLIRLACSEVWRAADVRRADQREAISVHSFDSREEQIRARLEQPVKDILLSLVWWYPEEYELLRILAEGESSFVAEYLEQDQGSLLRFAQYGLLTADARQFTIANLRDFLRSHGEAYKREVSPFTRGDMPPELLPQVPDLDALARLFEKRTEIEIALRRAIMLYLGVRHNWDNTKIAKAMQKGIHRRTGETSAADLFVGRTPQEVANDLYTIELKTIIVANWDAFGPLFSQNCNRFEMNMDTLNKARRIDGHSKPIPAEEAEEIGNSHAWLIARLRSIPKS